MSGHSQDYTVPMGWKVPDGGVGRHILFVEPDFWIEISATADGGYRYRSEGVPFAQYKDEIFDWMGVAVAWLRHELEEEDYD